MGDHMIYKRIRDLREDKDITQDKIANQLGVSQRSYSYYENGRNKIPLDILVAIADFHGVSTDYLLNRTDKKETNH